MKHITPLILIFCILFAVTGCAPDEKKQTPDSASATAGATQPANTDAPKPAGTLNLYFSATDSLNPYAAVTHGNQLLAPLLFDSLVKIDNEYNFSYELAESVKLNGKTCVIKLKQVKFTDGSVINAEDVTYSINAAKQSENSIYKQQMSNIQRAAAANASTVEIILNDFDPLFIYNLDFPVIKMHTINKKDKNDKPIPPIGTGRYVYSVSDGVYSLTPNKNYFKTPVNNNINLIHVPDSESLAYNLKSGSVDFYYSDMRDKKLPSMNGKRTAGISDSFIFIGINDKKEKISREIRKAASYAIDREELCESALYGLASGAVYPYPNAVYKANEHDFKANSQKVIEMLSKKGYNTLNTAGYYADENNKTVTLTLLYNSENSYHQNVAKLLAAQFKTAGIELELVSKKFNEYKKAVDRKDYELFLGEMKLCKSLDLKPVFSFISPPPSDTAATNAGGAPPANTSHYQEFLNSWSSYRKGNIELKEFIEQFDFHMPIIPIAYRCGVLVYNSRINADVYTSVSDVYYNIEELSK